MQDNTQFARTDKAITRALISLLQFKSFEKITVQDILDETPVTRSTFYKHFHDKYEVAEKMQADFLSAQIFIREKLLTNPASFSVALQQHIQQNHEIMLALSKIRTEKVDLRGALAEKLEAHYLDRSDSPQREIEAQVYAQALTAFQLANKKKGDFTFEYMNNVFISAMLMIIGLPDDPDILQLIRQKLSEKPNHFK